MNIGIEASNIKTGGGFTHLKELIENHKLCSDIKLFLFADNNVLNRIEDRTDLVKIGHPYLNKNFLWATLWRLFICKSVAKAHNIDIMFTPGGNFLTFKPYISMSQNMLVFETKERNRFPSLIARLRYISLEFKQVISFMNSNGIIFISTYAKEYITSKYPSLKSKKNIVIYHGVSDRFKLSGQKKIKDHTEFNLNNPFRLLYISIINYYKHQDKIVKGVARLRKEGIPVELHLIGPINPKIKEGFIKSIAPYKSFIHYHGPISYEEIDKFYRECDLFVFASTCENMPNILVEAMKAKAPILCSNYGPMPEILENGGAYFDPLVVEDFCEKVKTYFYSTQLRTKSSETNAVLSKKYSWRTTSEATFSFLQSLKD